MLQTIGKSIILTLIGYGIYKRYCLTKGRPIYKVKPSNPDTQNKINDLTRKMGIKQNVTSYYYSDVPGIALGCDQRWSTPLIIIDKYNSFIVAHELSHIKFNDNCVDMFYQLAHLGSVYIGHLLFQSIPISILFYMGIFYIRSIFSQIREKNADINATIYGTTIDLANFIEKLDRYMIENRFLRNYKKNIILLLYAKFKYDSTGNQRFCLKQFPIFSLHPYHSERIRYLKNIFYKNPPINLEVYIKLNENDELKQIDINNELNSNIRNKIRYSKKEITLISMNKIIFKQYLDKFQIEVYHPGSNDIKYYTFNGNMSSDTIILDIIDTIIQSNYIYIYGEWKDKVKEIDKEIDNLVKGIEKMHPKLIYNYYILKEQEFTLIFNGYI